VELPLVTAGDNVTYIPRFLKPGADSYTAADVIRQLLDQTQLPNDVAQVQGQSTPVSV